MRSIGEIIYIIKGILMLPVILPLIAIFFIIIKVTDSKTKKRFRTESKCMPVHERFQKDSDILREHFGIEVRELLEKLGNLRHVI